MSAKVARRIWDSALDRRLKPVLALMASYGDETGQQIFPSVARLAFQLGIQKLNVRRKINALLKWGVLVLVTSRGGGRGSNGRGRPATYLIDLEKLPTRAPYKAGAGATAKECTDASLKECAGAPLNDVEEGVRPRARRGAPVHKKGCAHAPRSFSDRYVEDQDQPAAPVHANAAEPKIPFRVFAAIASAALQELAFERQSDDPGAVAARFKTLCAQQGHRYDAPGLVQRAVDAALVARAKKQAELADLLARGRRS